jgi:hypothetical protein
MIRDLSLTLQAILDDPALATDFPELAAAQIVFDRPTETFNPAQTTIDLFLYDIRENMELRSNEPSYERLNGQTRIHRPPMRLVCSYLVTAWPVGGADLALQEHRLLSQVAQALARYPKIPAPFLRGNLIGQEPPLPMMTAQTDGPKEPAEFWTAIGNRLRASITVKATIGMEVFPPVDPPPFTVTTAVTRLGERAGPDGGEISLPSQLTSFWIGGRVTGAGNAPVTGALVTLVGTGLASRTGADGNYTLGSILAGPYILRVQSGSTTTDVNVTIPAPAGSNYNVQL